MPIRQSDLRAASVSDGIYESAGTIRTAKADKRKTAFLCHSHRDQDLASRLESYLRRVGWNIYIDWKDASMPSTPSLETAEKIQARIVELDWFLFLATQNSMSSRWCPWELGYADGRKGKEPIAVIPTVDDAGVSYGSEYMELYKRLDINASSRWAVIPPDRAYGKELHEM